MTYKNNYYICDIIQLKIINIMTTKVLISNDLRRKFVNKNFIIRFDGEITPFWTIHSAIGYEQAKFLGKEKFQTIIDKAIKKGGDKTKLQINHKLTCTLYSR